MTANSLKNDPSFVNMVILTADHTKVPLTRTEANEMEKYIFDQIYGSSGNVPRFKGEYVFCVEVGAVIINTHVDSVNWLKSMIACYRQKALIITDIKNRPQYTAKVRADVSKLDNNAIDNLLALLEAHNHGLQTAGWRLSSIANGVDQYNKRVCSVTFLIDDPGMKMLEENGFKLSVGFSTLTFALLARVMRSETTGEICKDVV